MSKLLVVTFDDEEQAYEGTKALRELDREGSITVYAGSVIARDDDGLVSVKDSADEGPIGTALGMLTGALVGALAGPQGMAVGAAAGTMLGATGDLINLGMGVDFVDEVAAHLPPGKVAAVAEVEEYWSTPVDSRMEAIGGTVYRRWRIDVEDEQIERDIAALKADYQDLKDELKQANEETKAKIQAKIDDNRAKLAAAGDRVEKKLDAMKAEATAKVEAIDAQIKSANEELKNKLEKRKADIKEDYETRSGKLKEAWALTKEALS